MTPLNIKSKIKNFFTIPEEVFKEEKTKKFEQIKLCSISRNNLFFGIIAFLILVNILVFFNINQFYIRAILGFIFIITIPGLLIMLMLKIRSVGFWEYLVYTIGLSVSFIMFGGLAVNWILPWLNITDKPLALLPVLTCFNIFLLSFWLIAFIKNQDLKPLKISFPKLDITNQIFFIVPVIFPVLSVLGAFILNNHGPNYLTMIMLGGIAIYVFCVVWFRDKLNENVYPWALWLMGLSLLLMYSLRSWYFMGSDVISEYHFFDLVTKNNLWDINSYAHSYNTCLSVNVLPTILNLSIGVEQLVLFKLFIQLIFSVILIVLYLLFKKFSTPLFSFLAVFFFMSQIGYMIDMPSHIRQEISFLFMGLIFLVLFNKNFSRGIKNLIIILFGFTLIVSHYSTGYLTIILFLTIIVIISLVSTIFKINKVYVEGLKKITPFLVLLFLIFGFLWYSQITSVVDGLVDFVHRSIDNFKNLFNEDMYTEGDSFLDQFRLKPIQEDRNLILQKEISNARNTTNPIDIYTSDKSQKYSTRFIPSKIIPSNFSTTLTSFFYSFLSIIKKLGYIFIFIGLIYSLIISKTNNNSEKFLISLIGIVFFFFVVLITLVPLGSIYYGSLRLYQQGLILFSIFMVLGVDFIFKKIKENYRFIIIFLFLIIYFLSFTGFFNQIVGGNFAFSNLNNFGHSYDTEYLSNTEVSSVSWLSHENTNKGSYASFIYKSPFYSFGNLHYIGWNIFPQVLKKDSYVYSGNSEVFEGVGFIYSRGGSLGFNFPTEFLNDNKNKIYNNGGSEIFK